MTNPEQQPLPINQDIEDCRQLSDLIFEDPEVGVRTDLIYAPLHFGVDVFSQHYLRFAGSYEDNIGKGIIEVIETYPIDGSQNPDLNMRCFVSELGDFGLTVDHDVLAKPLPVVWPQVFGAPQITACLHNFRNPEDEIEIDPERLLDELMVTHRRKDVKPHISYKQILGVEIAGYEIDFFHEKHSMPDVLASTININLSAGEILKMDVRHKGKDVLGSVMIFDRQGNLKGVRADKVNEVAKHVGVVAGFKRAVFDR